MSEINKSSSIPLNLSNIYIKNPEISKKDEVKIQIAEKDPETSKDNVCTTVNSKIPSICTSPISFVDQKESFSKSEYFNLSRVINDDPQKLSRTDIGKLNNYPDLQEKYHTKMNEIRKEKEKEKSDLKVSITANSTTNISSTSLFANKPNSSNSEYYSLSRKIENGNLSRTDIGNLKNYPDLQEKYHKLKSKNE